MSKPLTFTTRPPYLKRALELLVAWFVTGLGVAVVLGRVFRSEGYGSKP